MNQLGSAQVIPPKFLRPYQRVEWQHKKTVNYSVLLEDRLIEWAERETMTLFEG